MRGDESMKTNDISRTSRHSLRNVAREDHDRLSNHGPRSIDAARGILRKKSF